MSSKIIRSRGEPQSRITAAVDAEPVASAAYITAIPASMRSNGMRVVKLDDYSTWVFRSGSSATACESVLVPDAGTGRWLRDGQQASGMPMQNRLRLLGAPGKAVQGNTVTIGSDVYEARDDTPPSGGTVGRIWFYNGANSADSRANLIKAINHTIEAAKVTYPAAGVVEKFLAAAGQTTGDIDIVSATAAGGTPAASSTATACSETLATATDVWDSATCRAGSLAAQKRSAQVAVTITADDIAKSKLAIYFPFTPTTVILVNRSRPQNEVYTIVGNAVVLALAGGASPNNQAADVVDILASE